MFFSAGMIIHVNYRAWLTRRQQLASREFCAVEKTKCLYHAVAVYVYVWDWEK